MKIGILKETKTPVDNRVALTPNQIAQLKKDYPQVEFKVQSSATRCYTDEEYKALGITVTDDISDSDLLMGIKEAAIDTLIPDKRYLFFGHIAKQQEYNIPLFKRLIENRNTFSDYEYLVGDDGLRLVAFGWYAGIVGTYYTLMGWGLRNKTYRLPRPHLHFTIAELKQNLLDAEIGNVKIVITGSGRVSHGAQYILKEIGATELSIKDFCNPDVKPAGVSYCVAPIEELVKSDREDEFNFDHFVKHPEEYTQQFDRFAESADILLSCHFWSIGQPVYLSKEMIRDKRCRIKMVGDITCDIQGSIQSTLRSSTHSEPFFDYNPDTESEETAFSDDRNITVMAVDTCPNALPRETSEYFGSQLIEKVLTEILNKGNFDTKIFDRATIIKSGKLGLDFAYLQDYVDSFMKD